VVAVLVDGDVDVHDVAVLQRSQVGNAVADNLVHRRADTLGEAMIVQRGRIGSSLDRSLVDDAIELVTGDADLHRSAREVQHFTTDTAGRTNSFDLGGSVHANGRVRSLIKIFARWEAL
jgi:hypothetical protein